MNKRLLSLIDNIHDGRGIIDVGTDHGHIPVFLASHGYSGNIIASDINYGPLNSGMQSAKDAGVSDRIDFILCNGLEKCPPEKIDTILIAGMGGDTICGILDRDEWVMDSRYLLVLQPMTKAEVLRYWLVNNGFEILSEQLCEDAGRIYQIIISRFGACTKLTDSELFIGKYEFVHKSPLFNKRLTKLIENTGKSISGLEKASEKNKIEWRNLLCRIYDELIVMRERNNVNE